MRKLVLAAVAMLLVACGGDKATSPETVSGNYTLRTVNGANIPAPFYQDQFERDEFYDGNFVLSADHSWTGSLAVNAVELPGGAILFHQPLPVSGTYALSSGSITLTDAAHGLQMVGSVSGGTMSIGVDLGDVSKTSLVFSK
jgi:hypothetical protein